MARKDSLSDRALPSPMKSGGWPWGFLQRWGVGWPGAPGLAAFGIRNRVTAYSAIPDALLLCSYSVAHALHHPAGFTSCWMGDSIHS
jgi:hypothetical protein